MCQIPIKMLKEHATPNSSFTYLKDLFIKRVHKNYLVKDNKLAS